MGAAAGFLLMGAGIVAVLLAGSKAAGITSSTTSSSSSTAAPAAQGGPTVVGLVTWADLKLIGAMHGWTDRQIQDWASVVKSESNGTLSDTNPSSGAYGIAQFINGPGEYATYHGSASTVTGQLTAMANYIAQRYGNPSNAWTFHQANNYY